MVLVFALLLLICGMASTVFGGETLVEGAKAVGETAGMNPTAVGVVGVVVLLLMLVIGLLSVIKGGDWFVDSASFIATAGGIPPFLVGATIVSIATTLPEIIVSCTAAVQGSNDMAIGNAVGSVTANTAMIMSLAFIFLSVTIVRKEYIVQCLLLIGAAAVLLLGSLGGTLSVAGAVLLGMIFVGFMTYNVLDAKKKSTLDAVGNPQSRMKATGKEWAHNILWFIIGALVTVGGSNLLVYSCQELALLLGIPERLIAITLVSIGTSLPELVTTLTAIRKKESALSIGNIVGANIIDLTLILPVCGLLSGKNLPISGEMLILDLPACLLVTVLAMVPLLIRQKAGKVQGLISLAVYVAYIVISAV